MQVAEDIDRINLTLIGVNSLISRLDISMLHRPWVTCDLAHIVHLSSS